LSDFEIPLITTCAPQLAMLYLSLSGIPIKRAFKTPAYQVYSTMVIYM